MGPGITPVMQRKSLAFTLIELMIVVAMISIIAAVLIPAFLKARDRARQQQAVPTPAVPRDGGPWNVTDAPPLLSMHADAELSRWTSRVGMEVTSRYRLRFHGVFDAKGGQILSVPFPRNTEEASNVRVRVGNREPEHWELTARGLQIPLPAEGRAEVEYEAQGRDLVVLDLPPAGRLGEVSLDLRRPDVAEAELGQNSLQPTNSDATQWRWWFRGLISSAPIVVELPASHSLTSKVLQLCRMAGAAVLLFGLGFWYLGELYRPGCLARFKWGHFLMLALTYTFFFPVFTILSLNRGLPLTTALAVSLSLSLPLLLLHVWRSVDLRFASLYTLPLAVMTLGAVVNGVFGDHARELVWLAQAFLTIALVTLTYPRWTQHRGAWQRTLEAELAQRVQHLQQPAHELAQSLLAWEDKKVHGSVQTCIQQATAAHREFQRLEELASRLGEGTDYRELLWRTQALEKELPRVALRLQALQPEQTSAPGRLSHCMNCGHAGPDGASFCGQCGARTAFRLDCQCGAVSWLGRPLQSPCHCPGCGQKVSETTI